MRKEYCMTNYMAHLKAQLRQAEASHDLPRATALFQAIQRETWRTVPVAGMEGQACAT